MNSNMYKPYTYHICWSKENLHYYGVRYAQGCHPDDLWVKYPTSSKKVPLIREQYGEPDIIEVRKEFKTQEEAREWEVRVLKRLGVTKRDDWINECAFPACDRTGQKLSDITKEKMSKYHRNRPQTHQEKISKALKGRIPWNKGVFGAKRSETSKRKMSEAQKGNKNGRGNKGKIPWNKGLSSS